MKNLGIIIDSILEGHEAIAELIMSNDFAYNISEAKVNKKNIRTVAEYLKKLSKRRDKFLEIIKGAINEDLAIFENDEKVPEPWMKVNPWTGEANPNFDEKMAKEKQQERQKSGEEKFKEREEKQKREVDEKVALDKLYVDNPEEFYAKVFEAMSKDIIKPSIQRYAKIILDQLGQIKKTVLAIKEWGKQSGNNDAREKVANEIFNDVVKNFRFWKRHKDGLISTYKSLQEV